MGIVNVNLPATDAWKELMRQRTSHNLKEVMGNDEENMNIEDVKLIYKLSEDGEYATLYDVYEEGMEIERGIVVPLSSTYNRTETVHEGTKIVNVDGSSKDKIGTTNQKNNWIAIYRFITGKRAYRCCTDGKVHDDINPAEPETVQKCNAEKIYIYNLDCKIVGGHVIIGHIQNGVEKMGAKYNKAEIPDTDDIVAIMPICSSHNTYRKNDSYMLVYEDTPAVVLNYKLRKKVFQDYIK